MRGETVVITDALAVILLVVALFAWAWGSAWGEGASKSVGFALAAVFVGVMPRAVPYVAGLISGETPGEPSQKPKALWGGFDAEVSTVLTIGAVAVAVLGLAVVLVWLGPLAYGRSVAARDEARARRAARRQVEAQTRRRRAEEAVVWNDAVQQSRLLTQRMLAWGRDLDQLLRFPTMGDLSNPVTAAAYAAMLKVRQHEPPPDAEPPEGVTGDSPFPAAVREFALALEQAEAHAKKVGMSGLSSGERRQVRRIEKLLARLRDNATTEAERQACYRSIQGLLDGLIEVPVPQIRHALETVVAPRLAITAVPA